jgi:hypothetical protein
MSNLLPDLSVFNAKEPQQALDAAVAIVQSYCGWMIAPPATTSVDVWSRDGYTLVLPTLYLTAVNSITQNGVSIPTSNVTFETYGTVRAVSGVLSATKVYFLRQYKVTVNFTHGYDDWPAVVKDVILLCAQRSLTDTRGVVPRVTGGPKFIENRGPRLEVDDKSRLDPYALGGFA